MDIKPIRTEAYCTAALSEVERLWGAEMGTPAGEGTIGHVDPGYTINFDRNGAAIGTYAQRHLLVGLEAADGIRTQLRPV